MPVPALWTDIFDVAASNSPAGSEAVGPNMNAYLQAAFAYCKQVYEGQQKPIAAVPMNGQKLTGLANGTVATDAVAFGQIATALAGYLPLTGGIVSGASTFSAGVTFNSGTTFNGGVALNALLTASAPGKILVSSSDTQCLTVQSSSGALGPHIHMLDLTTGGRKYMRVSVNQFQIINAAYTLIAMAMDDSGNVTFSGNVTAFSDERLKTDWAPVGSDFVAGLAALKSGTYTRTDIKQRQAGISAQGLQKLLPEAVNADEGGQLSVAYGQAAMVACVELAKEVQALRRRLSELEYRR